jgi:lipase chaperone LimK
MLKLMPQQRFDELWTLDRTPACEDGMRLAHTFLELCGEAVDERNEAELDGDRFAFNRAWRDYAAHRKNCLKCLQR